MRATQAASDDERPLSLLLLCAVMAAGAFGVPMWANALLWPSSPSVDGIESADQMQSIVRRPVVVKPPPLGAVLPELRAQPSLPVLCVDPVAWERDRSAAGPPLVVRH